MKVFYIKGAFLKLPEDFEGDMVEALEVLAIRARYAKDNDIKGPAIDSWSETPIQAFDRIMADEVHMATTLTYLDEAEAIRKIL